MKKVHWLSRRELGAGALFTAAALPAITSASAKDRKLPIAPSVKIPADDRLDIIELMALYAWAYDSNNAEAFASTFTNDGVLEIFGNVMAAGRAAMPAFLETASAMRKDNGWQHLTDHHVFKAYDGKRCTAYSYYLMPESDASGGNVHLRAMGYYVSHCVKLDGQWLFAKRQVFRWNGKTPW